MHVSSPWRLEATRVIIAQYSQYKIDNNKIADEGL